jgi:hypothetical protein
MTTTGGLHGFWWFILGLSWSGRRVPGRSRKIRTRLQAHRERVAARQARRQVCHKREG